MREGYQVTVLFVMNAESPVEAARATFVKLCSTDERPTRFEVSRTRYTGSLQETMSLPIELGKENPLGRPAVIARNDSVCCGHCGSSLVSYHDNVDRQTKLFAREGAVFVSRSDLEENGDGRDPLAWCRACQKESALPRSLEWA